MLTIVQITQALRAAVEVSTLTWEALLGTALGPHIIVMSRIASTMGLSQTVELHIICISEVFQGGPIMANTKTALARGLQVTEAGIIVTLVVLLVTHIQVHTSRTVSGQAMQAVVLMVVEVLQFLILTV